MKTFFHRLFVILLSIFSFYYTNQVVHFLREQDVLMKEIKSTEFKYAIDAVDAKIEENTIRPGKKGKTIDYEKTYYYMKNYGTYNESLTVLKDTVPTISIMDHYDKYVVGGNTTRKWISFVFVLRKDSYLDSIIRILTKKNVEATFFIDGVYLEKYASLIEKMDPYEFELLSYQGEYKEAIFKTSISYLESLTNHSVKYCYVEEENSKVLDLCMKLKLYTIKPTLILKDDIYQEVRDQIRNSSIISFEVNSQVERELSIVIDYIQEKGYEIVSLDHLLSE